jgi:hypothetical protein
LLKAAHRDVDARGEDVPVAPTGLALVCSTPMEFKDTGPCHGIEPWSGFMASHRVAIRVRRAWAHRRDSYSREGALLQCGDALMREAKRAGYVS